MELDGEGNGMTEEVNPGFHQFLERGVSVDVQWLGSAQERKRGNQWHQSQNVVAVQMRQKEVRKILNGVVYGEKNILCASVAYVCSQRFLCKCFVSDCAA